MWVRLPVYSSGERTSISGWVPRMASTSSLNARIGSSLRCDDGIAGRRLGRDVQAGVAAFGQPQVTTAVEQAHVGVAEQREDPQRVGRPPVALVAVDHDGVVAGDAFAVHQLGELLAVDVVADPRVVEVGVPVDLHRAGDMADVVEQDVLVGFDDRQTGRAHVGRQPVGGDQPFGVGVGRQRGAWDLGEAAQLAKPTHHR